SGSLNHIASITSMGPDPSVDALKQRIESLEKTVGALDRPAELKLGDTGFSTIRTEYGAITLQWVGAAASGAGSKLTFKIGNPHAAKLNDIEIYGHPVGTDGKDIKSETLPWKLKGDAPKGSWADLTAIVDDVPPNRIASLRVTGVAVGGIGLSLP
ncbi:hypothetical protein, partial [Sphingobium sp.]|uniref:hypothetical protein n=1 Tax=Sphingobium sp. TaxID=1912891 RepID=UPI0028BD4868